jgi:hypothetical protein
MPEKRDNAEDVREILLETARVQLAALNAGIAFWSGWVDSAAKFAQSVNEELIRAGSKDTDTNAAIGRITDASREYLRKMTELPSAAISRFNENLVKQQGKGEPRRSAKVKD